MPSPKCTGKMCRSISSMSPRSMSCRPIEGENSSRFLPPAASSPIRTASAVAAHDLAELVPAQLAGVVSPELASTVPLGAAGLVGTLRTRGRHGAGRAAVRRHLPGTVGAAHVDVVPRPPRAPGRSAHSPRRRLISPLPCRSGVVPFDLWVEGSNGDPHEQESTVKYMLIMRASDEANAAFADADIDSTRSSSPWGASTRR